MTASNDERFRHGIAHFNREEFYDAHEVWEDVWRESSGPEKKFLQGLIQVAVSFHHHSTGNFVGARSLLVRARRNIEAYQQGSPGIAVPDLLESLNRCQAALADGSREVPFPEIDLED